MEVTLYKSFSKKRNSTKLPDAGVTTVVKNLKIKSNFGFENQNQSTKCSRLTPSFFIKDVDEFTYCKAWGNYYFIDDVEYDIQGSQYITCSMDVLGTFKDYISNYVCFIERSASNFNSDIYDEAISAEDGVEETSQAVSTLFGGNNGGCYILRVMGGGDTGVATYAFPTLADVAAFYNPLIDQIVNNMTPSGSTLEAIDNIIRMFCADPSDFVVGAYYSPLSYTWYSATGPSENIWCGWYETQQSAIRVSQSTHNMRVSISKPSNLYTDFRRTSNRFSTYYLYLPGIGTVPLSHDIVECDLELAVCIDTLCGGIHYRLIADGANVANYEGNIYVDLGIASSNNTGGFAELGAGLGLAVAGAATGGAGFLVGAAGATIKGIGDAMSGQSSLTTNQSSMASIRLDPDVIMSAVQKHSGDFPTVQYGRPCCKNLQIGTLNGFVKCGNASIDVPAISSVRKQINDYLNGGFYFE